MKIKQLQLQNYGRFEHLTIDFAPTEDRASNVTVIVGNNGAGKSQILQALATGFSWFVNGIRNEMNGFEIDKKFIKNGKNDVFVKVIADFNDYNYSSLFDGNKFSQWQVMNVHDGRNSSFNNENYELKSTISQYRQALTNNSKLSLPLIIFYPVERSIIGNSQADILSSDFDQLDGYFACVDGIGIDFYDFFQWYRQQEDIENEMLRYAKNDTSKDIEYYENHKLNLKDLQNQYDRLSPSILELSSQSDSEAVQRLKNGLETLKNQILELETYIKSQAHLFEFASNIQDLAKANRLRFQKLATIREAIEFFTGFKNPRIRRQGTPTMIVEKDGEELDVNQLSQGEKSLLALVGDIARRLAILNPSLDDPLQGEGVVMIDEVDLHLHPRWQHNLIDKLVRTFPNVQFILTTHSPLIVSDRADILVYLLDDGNLRSMDNIYGEDANTLLNDIFYVPPRTPEVEETFNAIRRAISNKELDNADEQIQQIAKRLSPSNNELLKLRLMLAHAKLAQNKVS